MRALTVQPGTAGTARLDELADPVAGDDELLVEGLALGVCGTDRDRLILGHESFGRVRHAPAGSDGPKVEAVTALGATYHHQPVADVAGRLQPDIVIEATGVASVVFDAIGNTGTYGITCLTGVSVPGRRISIDAGAENRQIVLDNDVVVGSVNANLRHYRAAADALTRADPTWLRRLITRRVPLDHFADALTTQDDDIKVVLTLTDGAG